MRLHLLVPGDPATRTGGYGYDRRMAAGLRARGREVEVHRLGGGFPRPAAADLAHAAAVLGSLPDDAYVLVDGLAAGAMPDVLASVGDRLRVAALVHHPLALETGLDPAAAVRLRDSEREALRHVRRVIVTSAATARALIADYAVPAARVAAVPPGTDTAPLAQGSRDGVTTLLCVGAVVPRKGHDVLLDALEPLADRPWRLVCAGSVDRDRDWSARMLHRVGHGPLASRVAFAGELEDDALAAHYAAADAFVLATHHEGYGMAFAEALARGLPVIGTTAGAVPDTVPRDAGLLVAPGDVPALREALRRLLADAALRASLAAGAQRARLALPRWDDAARRLDEVLFP